MKGTQGLSHIGFIGEMQGQLGLATAVAHQLVNKQSWFICISWAEDTWGQNGYELGSHEQYVLIQ